MTLSERTIAKVIRRAVKAAIAEAVSKTRTSKQLTGTVEELDEDLDVVWVRMDDEAISTDPTQSLNFENPGVIPATRLGPAFNDDQVRVSFDGAAGPSASQTSLKNQFVVPYGAETGKRIMLDGETGSLRIRSETDTLVGLVDQSGYTIREDPSGLVVAEMSPSRFRLADPEGTDDIVLTARPEATLPRPLYKATVEANPSTTVVVPAMSKLFSTDDLAIHHVVAAKLGSFTGTWTPPGGETERVDTAHTNMSVSIADRNPATTAAQTFTNSASDASIGIGTTIIVQGPSPSYRSETHGNFGPTTGSQLVMSLAKPSGVVQNDILIAFVTMTNEGGSVPVGWTTPDGWVFLGATFNVTNSFCCAVGAWAKLAGSSEPSSYEVEVSFGAGTKRVQAAIIAVQSGYTIPGGAYINIGGYPVKRLLAHFELAAADTDLCDITNIPANFRHLSIVYNAYSGTNADAVRDLFLNFNNDGGANYHYRITSNAVSSQGLNAGGIVVGKINGLTTGHSSWGEITVLNYANTGVSRQVLVGSGHEQNGALHEHRVAAQWNNTANAITSVQLVAFSPDPAACAAGSEVWVFGW